MFNWFQGRRRQHLQETPFPREWEGYLHENFAQFASLSAEEQAHLRDLTQVFVAEKNWEGVGGLPLTDEIKVTIAAQACFLLLGLPDHDFYPNVTAILVYPDAYKVQDTHIGPGGIHHETPGAHLGEAWRDGPVILSWADARHGGQNPHDGHNVVLHEFAHKLDMRDGYADGVPPLYADQKQYDTWAEVMQAEYNLLVEETEDGRADILDDYGAENPAEFFAVATETFFEKARSLREKHSRLYEVLRGYYRQDPAARLHETPDSSPGKEESPIFA